MTDPTAEFFKRLQGRPKMLSPQLNGTVRFDLDVGKGQTEHWYVELRNGEARVQRLNREADCTVRAEKKTFDRLAMGEESVLSALLLNTMSVRGEMHFLPIIRKFLPGPPGSRDPRDVARGEQQS